MLAVALARAASALDEGERAALATAGLEPGQVGFIALDVASGRVLAAHNPDVAFVPASVAKVPSIYAALAILGPEHRFRTRLVLDEAGEGRAVTLAGGGDPHLSTDDLGPFVEALAALGPVTAFGYDDSALPVLARIVADQPEAAAFNPGVAALSLNFNRVLAEFDPRGGRPPAAFGVATRRTASDWIALAPRPGAGAPTDLRHALTPRGEAWTFPAGARMPRTLWLPVRAPARNAAMLLRQLASARGIVLPLPQRATARGREIAVHESRPLPEIAREALRFSNNLTAELIGLAAAHALQARPQTLEASAGVLADWLRRRLPDADLGAMRLLNHSGLTGASRVSARQTALILAAAGRGALAPAPAAGLMSPLRESAPPAEAGARPIEAKSGTLWFAQGLAGLAVAASGRRIAFAVYAVDWPQRRALDGLPPERAAAAPPGAADWTRRARTLTHTLARRFADGF